MAEVPPSEDTPGEDLSRAIVSAAADGIVAVDDRGIIRLCNRSAERLLGRTAAQLVGSQFGYPLTEGAAEIELILPRLRNRVVEMRVTSTIWNKEPLHVVALRDVTRRRKHEQDLEGALDRQNVVIAVAAHELRNPLAAIAILAEVLRNPNTTLNEQQRSDAIDRIAERTNHLQALIAKVLTASRIDATGGASIPEPVAVLELLLERLSDFSLDDIDLHLSCDPTLTALVDRGQLDEMLTNYLENALAYGRPPIEIRADRHDSQIEIRVSDAGPGVPDSFVPQLFDRFTRAPGAPHDQHGSGLGLWIVRHLARANHGDAWYEPADNGACFCLRLPNAPPDPAQ